MSRSILFLINNLYKCKWRFLSERLMVLTLLLYEQFIHQTQVILCPNMQFLSTQQRAYQSYQVISGLDSVCIHVACIHVACWVNLKMFT